MAWSLFYIPQIPQAYLDLKLTKILEEQKLNSPSLVIYLPTPYN